MRNFYLLMMASLLAACSGQEAEQGTPPVITKPIVTASPVAPAPPTAVASMETAVLAKRQAIARMTASSEPRRRPRAGRARVVVSPTTLANHQASSAGDETVRSSLGDTFVFAEPKAAQSFWIRPQRDTVLVATEGTTIWVPAQAFTVMGADLPALSAPVEVRVREFYSLSDILLNNLTTDSGEGLLETGGMLHLEARNATGQVCALRPGTELLLRMPAPRPQPGMQLYTGVPTAAHGLDWKNPVNALRPEQFRVAGPSVPNERLLKVQLRQAVGFSVGTAQRLRSRPRTREQRRQLRRSSRFVGTPLLEWGTLLVETDSRGVVTSAQTYGILDSAVQTSLRTAALQLPAFMPAVMQGPIPAKKTAKRDRLVTPRRQRHSPPAPRLPQFPIAGIWRLYLGINRDGRLWMPWPGFGHAGTLGSSANRQTFDPKTARKQVHQATAQSLQATSLDSLSGYLFSAARLGWVNCDRPVEFKGARINYAVAAEVPNIRMQLVFRRVRSVVASNPRSLAGKYYFQAAPLHEPATIVAFKRTAGITYLATKEITVSETPEEDLVFTPVTPAELRTALAQLER